MRDSVRGRTRSCVFGLAKYRISRSPRVKTPRYKITVSSNGKRFFKHSRENNEKIRSFREFRQARSAKNSSRFPKASFIPGARCKRFFFLFRGTVIYRNNSPFPLTWKQVRITRTKTIAAVYTGTRTIRTRVCKWLLRSNHILRTCPAR